MVKFSIIDGKFVLNGNIIEVVVIKREKLEVNLDRTRERYPSCQVIMAASRISSIQASYWTTDLMTYFSRHVKADCISWPTFFPRLDRFY